MIFLDIEASALLRGYPIEIGWVHANGKSTTFLIKPSEHWLAKGYIWSADSEMVHGISFKTLLEVGDPVEWAANQATLSLRGQAVFSDAPTWDNPWLDMIVSHALDSAPITVCDVAEAYGEACRPLVRAFGNEAAAAMSLEIVTEAQDREEQREGVRHRAGADAISLQRTWEAITDSVAARLSAAGLGR